MTDLVIRPLTAGEEPLFDTLTDPGLLGLAASGVTYQDMLARREYRPDWTWVALRDGELVARAAWWAGPDEDTPLALDWFDFTDHDAAVRLLRTAPHRVEYTLRMPPDWRERPAVRRAAETRIAATEAAGYAVLVERYRYRWTPECGLPARTGRLEFRPEPDDAVILDVFRRVLHGTLDAHGRHAMAVSGVDAAAKADLDILHWMPAPREWWRLAYTADGDLVGFTAPSRNHSDPVIGYIAVLPEHRGHGYAYDLLIETTHMLINEGADRVVAATDVTNTPMADTFARAGYPIDQYRIDLVPTQA